MKSLSEIIESVKKLCRDRDDVVSVADYTDAINQAVWIYSQVSPLTAYEDITGNGVTFAWEVADDYDAEFSSITRVLYPFNSLQDYTELSPENYAIVKEGVTTKLVLTTTPASGETVRYYYTALHYVTDTASTLTTAAEHQVTYAAASIVCTQLASHYAQHRPSTIEADSIDYALKSRQYVELAERYSKMSGLDSRFSASSTPIASSSRDFDPPPPWGGYSDFVVHRKAER